MASTRKHRDTGCPIAFALDMFGDRWSLLIIRDLLFQGAETYGEFLEADEGIATNVLADRLKELEAADIIQKARDPNNRRRYLYTLTEKGADLTPILLEMVRWSGKYNPPQTRVRKKILKRIEDDRDEFANELRTDALNRD